MSCGVSRRCGSDLALLWLWWRLAPIAPIRSLAWELPYATGAALEKTKKKKNCAGIIPHCSWWQWTWKRYAFGRNSMYSFIQSRIQRRILNPLSKAGDWPCNLMVPSWIHFPCATTGTPIHSLFFFFFFKIYFIFIYLFIFIYFLNLFFFPLYSKGIKLFLHVYICFPHPLFCCIEYLLIQRFPFLSFYSL